METTVVTEWPRGTLILCLCSFLIPQMDTPPWVFPFPTLGSQSGYGGKLALDKGIL